MGGEIVGIVAVAVLFAAFVALRPPDRGEGGCHACAHGSDECGSGTCPLLRGL